MRLARAVAPLGVATALFAWPLLGLAVEVPALRGHVNDYADVIPPDAEARLERKLTAYEEATGRQYAVLTIPTLEGEDIEGFSIRTVESWKLGQKKQDNGLLLLVVPDDKKVRIEVGYGLEGEITDLRASRVIREILTPAFRSGDYAGGIERGLDSLMGATAGAPEGARGRAVQRAPASIFEIALVTLFFLLPLLGSLFGMRGGGKKRRRGRRYGGGGYWGGFDGGGGFGGGDFGGGGFSGGGGSFGGGGASGSW
jgi:uncharacterized protein